MMNSAVLINFEFYLREKGISFERDVRLGSIHIKSDNAYGLYSTWDIFVLQQASYNDIQIRIYGLGRSVKPEKDFLELINRLNFKYRWCKVFIEDDGEISMTRDITVTNNSNEEIYNHLTEFIELANKVYQEIYEEDW